MPFSRVILLACAFVVSSADIGEPFSQKKPVVRIERQHTEPPTSTVRKWKPTELADAPSKLPR